jgi:pyruvate dehydrogenase E1 component alpha subunit
VCENNKYGMGTSVDRASAVPEIRQKAQGYDIPNSRVDGMDVMAVRKAALEVIEKVRGGGGPYLLEAVTYRYRGHSMGDPERYRQVDEVKRWQEHDSIGIFRRYLINKKYSTDEELDRTDQRVEAEVEEAVQFAESSPEPAPETLFENVYAQA